MQILLQNAVSKFSLSTRPVFVRLGYWPVRGNETEKRKVSSLKQSKINCGKKRLAQIYRNTSP